MKKQKITLSMGIFLSLFAFLVVAGNVQAAGSATVSWTPPTTDEGGGELTGLAGYKIFYSTTSNWANQTGTCLVEQGNVVDVPGGEKNSYRFINNLIPGQTYYFAVAAYDDASTPNVSKCATGAGAITEVSKRVTYSGDLDKNNTVNMADYNILKVNFSSNNSVGDVNGDGSVGMADYNMLKPDFGYSFN